MFIYPINQLTINNMTLKSSFFAKRGVSPLIATILLISFAVALGSVVLNWGKNIDMSKSEDTCSGASIKIKSIGNSEVCYAGSGENGYINFIISNNGDIDIAGLAIWIVGQKGTKLLDLDDFSIKKGDVLGVEDNSVKYDFNTYGNIKYIQFIPKVKITDSMDICPRNSVKAEKISVCD